MDIKHALQTIFRIAGIQNKAQLDNWCIGQGRAKLYDEVQRLAPAHYNSLPTPQSSVRACYERMLPGYKIHQNV